MASWWRALDGPVVHNPSPQPDTASVPGGASSSSIYRAAWPQAGGNLGRLVCPTRRAEGSACDQRSCRKHGGILVGTLKRRSGRRLPVVTTRRFSRFGQGQNSPPPIRPTQFVVRINPEPRRPLKRRPCAAAGEVEEWARKPERPYPPRVQFGRVMGQPRTRRFRPASRRTRH